MFEYALIRADRRFRGIILIRDDDPKRSGKITQDAGAVPSVALEDVSCRYGVEDGEGRMGELANDS